MIQKPMAFFRAAPTILTRDALAEFLGASEDGLIEYHYEDAVALAGHSCPTVASAFLMTRTALRQLYPDSTPERGGAAVAWRDARSEGVTGVMANVAMLITGAADEGGFHGIGGHFTRRDLLSFNVPMTGDVRFTRLDNGAKVELSASLGTVPMHPAVRSLMPACIAGHATAEQKKTFGEAWQARVRTLLLEHADDPDVIIIH